MKGKIITLLICMMLLITFFAVSKNNEKLAINEDIKDIKPLSFDEVEAPVWESGDSWTYNIANMEFVIDDENLSENLTLIINAQIGDFTLEVIDDTGDIYQVGIIETTIEGNYLLDTDFGDGPIRVSGDLEDTVLAGNLYFNKSDLGVAKFEGLVDGKLTVNIEEQPYFDRSVFPKIPIPMTIYLEVEMENPFPVIQFPLNSSFMVWGMPAINASIGGTIESIWLNIFNFINQKIRKWGIIPPIARIFGLDEQMLQDASDMIDDILPIIDIKYVLNEYLEVNNWVNTPELPFMFFCNDTAEITVPAGTFDTYEILIAGGLGTIYYAPEVGNIIKIEGNFADALPFLNGIDAELKEYNYN